MAAPNPLYVLGHYNQPNDAHLNTTNTSSTLPAALLGDAITLLSGAWRDSLGRQPLSMRVAADTTVNAALLGGIVPSDGTNYSGGVYGFPRLLEDWSPGGVRRTLTFNGSMVALFHSEYATAPWGRPAVYGAPSRRWSFDSNFLDPAKLPPGTPAVRIPEAGDW